MAMTMKSQLDNGLSSTGGVHFIDKDRHDWKIVITAGDGKVYFDATWNVSRRKE
jgi:hypothetical protein